MSPRFSSSTRRVFVLAFSLVCALLLSCFSIRNAFAAHYSALQTLEGYEPATRLEPRDFRNWQLLGPYWQYNLEDAATDPAIRPYTPPPTPNPPSPCISSDLRTPSY